MASSSSGQTAPIELPLEPIRKAPKTKEILVYDVESKHEDSTTEPGFTRPFMVGFLDADGKYHAFFDENRSSKLDFRRRVVAEGGCIDRFCKHLFGLRKGRGGSLRRFLQPFTSDRCDVYAHNGGRFDATFLLVWLYQHRDLYDVTITCVQGRVQSLKVTPKGRDFPKNQTISVLDSALLLPMKLSQATTLFSTGETKQADFDQRTNERETEIWKLYNERDCRGLRDALVGFRNLLESEGGEISMTTPASSMKLFRRRFLKEKIDRGKHFPWCDGLCHGCTRAGACDGDCHGCLHEWIRKGYFGGRVEIFERFAPAPVFYYDLNSSYPASMMEPMPVGKPTIVLDERGFFEQWEARKKDGEIGFVECKVYIPPACSIPPLPHLHDGKLKFPTGMFSGVFELEELLLLFDPFVSGKILSVDRAVFFRGKTIFKEFVETLYKYKNEKPKGDPKTFNEEQKRKLAIAELSKLMLNSLYGKFAMNAEREEVLYVGKDDKWPDDARPIDGRHETCRVWVKPRYVDPSYVIPHISARITALSRARWWRQARDVVLSGGKVFYGDTDAILASIPFAQDVIHPTRLGAWKREYEREELSGEFILPKFYALYSDDFSDQHIHMKGVDRRFQTFETFRMLASGGELRVEKSRTSQPKTVLRALEKGDVFGMHMLDSVKRLRSKYDKRVVYDDGTTSPLVLDET